MSLIYTNLKFNNQADDYYYLSLHGQIYDKGYSGHYFHLMFEQLNVENPSPSDLFYPKGLTDRKFPSLHINNLANFPLGTVIHKGKIHRTPSNYLKPQIFELENLSKVSIESINTINDKLVGSENNLFLRGISLLRKYEMPHLSLKKDVHFIHNNESIKTLIVPCSELFRFYYLSKDTFNHRLLSGNNIEGADGLYDPEKSGLRFDEKGNKYFQVWLRRGIVKEDIMTLFRLLQSQYGISELKKIYPKKFENANKKRKSALYCRFPHEKTKVKMVGRVMNETIFYCQEIIADFTSPEVDLLKWNSDEDNRTQEGVDKNEMEDYHRGGSGKSLTSSDQDEQDIEVTSEPGNASLLQMEHLIDENRFPNFKKVEMERLPRSKDQTHKSAGGWSSGREPGNYSSESYGGSHSQETGILNNKRDQEENLSKKDKAKVIKFRQLIKEILCGFNKMNETEAAILKSGCLVDLLNSAEGDLLHLLEDKEMRRWFKMNYNRSKDTYDGDKQYILLEIEHKKKYYYLLDYNMKFPSDHRMICFTRTNGEKMHESYLKLIYKEVVINQGKKTDDKSFEEIEGLVIEFKKHPHAIKDGKSNIKNTEENLIDENPCSKTYKINSFVSNFQSTFMS